MSDDVKKLQQAMTAVQGHLQDMQHEQKATSHDLKSMSGAVKRLEARSTHQEATLAALAGTFASIEQILVKLAADHERVEAMAAEHADILRRLERLEQKAG